MASQNMNEDDVFKNNDLIWGQLNNGPWWPGQITSDTKNSRKKLYRVDFFGYPPAHAFLPLSKITKYENNINILQKGRVSPSLKRAISQANILYKTLEESKNQLAIVQEGKPISLGNLPDQKTALMQPERHDEEIKEEETRKPQRAKLKVKPTQGTRKIVKHKKIRKQKGCRKQVPKNQNVEDSSSSPNQSMELNHHRLFVRKLYNMLKKSNGKTKSRKLAVQLAEKKDKTQNWRDIFEECKKQCQKGKKNVGGKVLKRLTN